MRASTKGLLTTLIITSTLTLGACQQQKQTETKDKSVPTSQTTQATPTTQTKTAQNRDEITPDGWLIIDNETFIPVVDKLGKNLALARRNYLKGDNAAAAVGMREGAAFLKQELSQASTEGQAALNKASEDLMKNAALVESGKIDSVKDLDKVFATAYQADTEQLWIVADEQDWIPIIEMPQQHWQTAKREFLNGKKQIAATEIRKGIAFISLEANRTDDQSIKSNLANAAQNLEQLAKDVKAGKVFDVKVLDRAFARGQLAMGQFYESQAKESESRGELVTAGQEVIGAFHHLQAANNWLGKDESNLQKAQAEINHVKDSMRSPNEAQSRNLSKAILTIDKQINNLNQNITKS